VLVLLAPRRLLPWAVGLLAFTALARLLVQWNAIRYPAIWVLPITRLDPFIVGAGCAWIYRHRRSWLDQSFAGPVLMVAGVAGLFLVTFFSYVTSGSLSLAWQFTVIALGAGCLLLSALSSAGLGLMLSWRPVVYCGKISFGLYVFHLIPILIVTRVLHLEDAVARTPLMWTLLFIVEFCGTLALAALSYRWLELPFLRLKERFELVRSRAA
jgi:peptidoglycan/LPS O-acetylase OafA/YrhL